MNPESSCIDEKYVRVWRDIHGYMMECWVLKTDLTLRELESVYVNGYLDMDEFEKLANIQVEREFC